jgi:hypothetical protein
MVDGDRAYKRNDEGAARVYEETAAREGFPLERAASRFRMIDRRADFRRQLIFHVRHDSDRFQLRAADDGEGTLARRAFDG